MSNEISLKDCAVISLDEYSRLKGIEASSNDSIYNYLPFMIDELTSKGAACIKYKGFTLTRSEVDFSFNLHIPKGVANERVNN